jgi:putative chitinase
MRTTVEYASGKAYEGRRDLGNVFKGDGTRYKGRGLIQLTGRHNYDLASKALGYDLVGNPELAAEFPVALLVPAWYWTQKGLNRLADRDDIRSITKRVNGGFNGLSDRIKYLNRFKSLLGVK